MYALLAYFNDTPAASSENFIWALVRMLVALGIVCGLAYVALKFGLKRLYTLAQPASAIGSRWVKVIEHIPLSAAPLSRTSSERSLWVVQIGKRTLVLSSTENGISLLTEIEDEKVA